METMIGKARLGAWMAALGTRAAVYAPVLADEVWEYRRVGADAAGAGLDHPNTVRSPKGFTFPQREVLFRFRQEPGSAPELTPAVPLIEPVVVFGVRPCDGRAMLRNDRVFGGGIADPYYQARRRSVILVGLACTVPPSPNCFCLSVGGSPQSEDGLDVLMTGLEGRYHVKALSARGVGIVEQARDLFDEVRVGDRTEVERSHDAALSRPQRGVGSLQAVAAGLERTFDSPLWAERARACLGCGACTYLCPSCHCFDINDEVACQRPLAGERVRSWDNCQFPDFTMHASGHNPRKSAASRLRQRVCHKFLYFVDTHGLQQCTGCGRCISHCPVGIDIVRVVDEVSRQ